MKILGNVYKPVKGKKPVVLFDSFKEGLVPYLSANYFRTGKASQWVDPSDKNYVPVEPDNIVILWDGSKSGDVFTGLHGALSSTMSRLDGDGSYEDRFTYYYLKTKFHVLNTQTTGSTIPHVNGNVLKNLEMPSIDGPTQARIVSQLDTIRLAIQTQRTMNHKLERLKKSMTRHLFTYGTQNNKTKQTKIGEIPISWELNYLGTLMAVKPSNGIYKPMADYGSGISIVRIDDFGLDGAAITRASNRVKLSDSEIAKYQLRSGDIVLNRVNSLSHLGKVGIVGDLQEPLVFESNMMRFRIYDEEYLPHYIVAYLSSDIGRSQILEKAKRAVAQASVNQGDIQSVLIPVPPAAERRKIIETLTSIDQKIQSASSKARIYKRLFDSLLNQLMTDKIEVS